jgi:hypothetical protein
MSVIVLRKIDFRWRIILARNAQIFLEAIFLSCKVAYIGVSDGSSDSYGVLFHYKMGVVQS